jgi:hypothetical protein
MVFRRGRVSWWNWCTRRVSADTSLYATPLNKDVDHVTILIDGSPEIVPRAPDVHEQLVQMPDVSPSTQPTSEVPSVVESELLTPLLYGLVGDDDSAVRKEVLDVSEAQ